MRAKEAMYLSQDEILERCDKDTLNFRYAYHFLSQQVHTLPISFYRVYESGEAIGIENEKEKGYITITIEWIIQIIEDAVHHIKILFSDFENYFHLMEN